MYEKYKPQGFEILGFPSNDFAQEAKEGAKITEFCQVNYGVQFKIFAKNKVKGSDAQPLYKYLAEQTKVAFFNNYPIWNFQKYLIGRDGKVADWFIPFKSPDNAKITEAIENCLKN